MARLSQRTRVIASPSSRSTTESPPPHSSARKRGRSPPSSRREVVEESDDEFATQDRAHVYHIETLEVKDNVRQKKKARLLAELQTSITLTPESVPSTSSTSRITGLKVPEKDTRATRRSNRSSASKPVLYNMKIHPQDHSLPFRRTQESLSRLDDSDPEQSDYNATDDTGREDIVRAGDVEELLDNNVFVTSIREGSARNLKAARLLPQRSARKAVTAISYDMKWHPMDAAVDWSTSKRRRRQVLQQDVDLAEASSTREEEAASTIDDAGTRNHHDLDDELLHDFVADDSGSVELGESSGEAYLPSHTTSKTLSARGWQDEDINLDEIGMNLENNLQHRGNDISSARHITDVASVLAAVTGPSGTLQMLSNDALTDTVTSTSLSDQSLIPERRPSDSQRKAKAKGDIAIAPRRLRRQSDP